jgi:hypothetical protein
MLNTGASHVLALFSHESTMMDTQTIINTGIGIIIAGGGWFARALWDAVQKLQADIHQLEVEMPTHYIRRDEFQDGMREIKEMLGKIFDRLDNKQDK